MTVLTLLLLLSYVLLLQCMSCQCTAVKNCCNTIEDNDTDVIQCITANNIIRNEGILQQKAVYLSLKQGPRYIITILTRTTVDIYDYAKYSLLAQSLYASMRGYGYHIDQSAAIENIDYKYYPKLQPLLSFLTNGTLIGGHSDYVVWLDADVTILDMDMQIEDIIASYPSAHIIVSADVSSLANTGVLILRNSPWTIRYLTEWLQVRHNPSAYNDQIGFEILYKRYSQRSNSSHSIKVVVLPPDAINSDASPIEKQRGHNKVLHLAAEHSLMRAQIFKHAADCLCTNDVNTPKGYIPQLGLTKDMLQRTALQVYGDLARALLNQSLSSSTYQHNILSEIQQVSSKYCFVLNLVGSQEEEIDRVKSSTYRIAESVMGTISGYVTGDVSLTIPMDDVPQIVKVCCEIMLDSMVACDNRSMKRSMGRVILSHLHYLLQITLSAQRYLVMDMQASLFYFLGEIDLMDGMIDSSESLMQQSLALYATMGGGGYTGDRRSYYSALALYAQLLCSTSRYDEGIQALHKAIELEAVHIGGEHSNLVSKYYNLAVCMIHNQMHNEGVAMLHKTIEVTALHSNVRFIQHFKDKATAMLSSSGVLETLIVGEIREIGE